MAESVINFLLDDLKQILRHRTNIIISDLWQIELLYEDVIIVRFLLNYILKIQNEHEELKSLVREIKNVAFKLLHDVDLFVVRVLIKRDQNMTGKSFLVFDDPLKLINLKEISSIKKRVMDFSVRKLSVTAEPEAAICSIETSFRAAGPSAKEDELMIGFVDEALTIKDQLIQVHNEKLEVISIVGMAGIGKTTLARHLYNDDYIVYHFHIRSWTCVSQVYQKRDLLLSFLNCIFEGNKCLKEMSNEKLGEELYRNLKGRRYLIVMDDIWNIESWEDFRRYFPNDNNGSRIMITTRLKEVALTIKPDSIPHSLHFLTEDQSWDLLSQKAFVEKGCPQELMEVGKQIAAKCQGLPLAIVVVAGLLSKKERTKQFWIHVSETLGSYIGNEEQFMDVLALSFDHLPHHLQSCFLYFGAFPEDYKIPVWRMIRLWIAEGLVKPVEQKSLEDVAEGYLMDLIDRSLVEVSTKKLNGGIKTCCIHDMLRSLCLRKAKERESLQLFDWYDRVASPSNPISFNYPCFHSHGFHKFSGKPCSPNFRSHFLYASEKTAPPKTHTIAFIYKFLRVLNLWYIFLQNFPLEITQLFRLRFLELHLERLNELPSEISNLWNLESLIIDKKERSGVTIPRSIWKMEKLRHLRISEEIEFEKPLTNDENPLVLNELQTISALSLPRSGKDAEYVLERTPNLRKLTFYRRPLKNGSFSLPDLSNLRHLESLKLSVWKPTHSRIPEPHKFPQMLKKLNLSGGHLPWKEISNIGELPNLEVLKISRKFFSGPCWETSDGEFLRLKYLKLKWMDLRQWVTSTSHFPSLQRLVLQSCRKLIEIPASIGDVPTLQMIEVYWLSRSARNSAQKFCQKN